jgi:hypothetical protein
LVMHQKILLNRTGLISSNQKFYPKYLNEDSPNELIQTIED